MPDEAANRFSAGAGMSRRGVVGAAGAGAVALGWPFATKAVRKLPDHLVRYYVSLLARNRRALRGRLGWYRALDTTIAQNEQRKTRRLTLPVLASGGAASSGMGVADAMKLAATTCRPW